MPNGWKTSANGILAFLITTLTVLTAFQVPAALVPGSDKTLMYLTLAANLLLALCRAWVGLIQNDSPPPPPPASK